MTSCQNHTAQNSESELENEIRDNGSLHIFRTEIPNIVYELELDPFELTLYNILKRTAGDRGSCFKSNARLAKECGMSERKFDDTKKKLCQPREKLGGYSLITVSHRLKASGGKDTDLITINNIWPENMDYFNKRLRTARHAPPLAHDMRYPSAPHAPKEDLLEEDLKELTTKSACAQEKQLAFSEKIISELRNFGIDDLTIKSIEKLKPTDKQVLDALANAEQNKATIQNKNAYVYSAVEGKWKPKPKVENVTDENKAWAEDLEKRSQGKLLNSCIFLACNSYCEVGISNKMETFDYAMPDFKNKIDQALKKYQRKLT